VRVARVEDEKAQAVAEAARLTEVVASLDKVTPKCAREKMHDSAVRRLVGFLPLPPASLSFPSLCFAITHVRCRKSRSSCVSALSRRTSRPRSPILSRQAARLFQRSSLCYPISLQPILLWPIPLLSNPFAIQSLSYPNPPIPLLSDPLLSYPLAVRFLALRSRSSCSPIPCCTYPQV
jgi:hypothetical protein